MDRTGESLLRNMRFTLEAMAALPASRTLSLGDESFLLAGGTDAASENWAFVPTASLKKETVRRALGFFKELQLPFIWPVLPEADNGYRHVLEDFGLACQGHLTAMARAVPAQQQPPQADGLSCQPISTREEAALWAEIAWRAFDSPSGAPAAFVRLAQGLLERDSFLLAIARRAGQPAGTFALSFSAAEAGVYYFATLPERRRSGIATAMMNAIFRLARERSSGLVTLQATPAGAPFYASQGFQKLFDIPVHSSTPEIF